MWDVVTQTNWADILVTFCVDAPTGTIQSENNILAIGHQAGGAGKKVG